MFVFYSFVILSLGYLTNSEEVKLPSYMQACDVREKKFTECVKIQIENCLTKFTKGVSELGVPSIEPTYLDDIKINGNGLNLSFTGPAMHGVSKSKLTDLQVKLGIPEETFVLSFKSNLSLTAKYLINGRILILPIVGKGDAIVDAQGVEVNISCKLAHMNDSKGTEYFKLVHPQYKYTIEKTTFDLKNLFNGNKQLGETTLKFANENWEQLMDELSPPVIKQIVRTVVKVINKFFSKVPINVMIIGYEEYKKKYQL